MTIEASTTGDRELEHLALIYSGPEEYAAGTRAFIEAGVEADEPVLVAVPGSKIGTMMTMINGSAERVELWDISRLGRNPGRLIPAVRDWVDGHGAARCRLISEPTWGGRSACEVVEAARHEALVNLAFADVAVTILCAYDAVGLDRTVLTDAERTHPRLIRGGDGCASESYCDPLALWQASDRPLPQPAQAAAKLPIGLELAEVRRFTAAELREAGVQEDRLNDLVLAVDEAATNALVHGIGPAEVRIWRDGGSVVCEITDEGSLEEPLAGRRRPRPDWPSGRGVWLMNQLCDLVELRPTSTGTAVRLHVEVDCGANSVPATACPQAKPAGPD